MCSVSLLYCKPLPGRRRKWHNSARGGKTGQRTNIHSTAFNIHCYWPIFQSCLPYHQPRDQLLTQFKMGYILFNAVAHCGFSFDILTFVHFTSYQFVLRVFDSQSESSFLLTFVPCLLLPLIALSLSFLSRFL